MDRGTDIGERQCNVSAKMEHAGISLVTTVGLSVPILGSCLMSGGDLEKKTFFKLTVRTHDLGHMTKAMLATSQHNHLTICPLKTSEIILNIACHGSASRQHKMIFPSKWYLHPN